MIPDPEFVEELTWGRLPATEGSQLTRLEAEQPVFSAERITAGAEAEAGVSADAPAGPIPKLVDAPLLPVKSDLFLELTF